MRLIYEDLTYQLRGIFYQTYNSLGPGFNEKIYQEICFLKCLEAGIEAKKEHGVSVIYKGHEITNLSLDLLVDDKVIVEFKAVDSITSVHKAQIICYLKALTIPIGLLANFSLRGVQIERLANFRRKAQLRG
jgi:GxxExxY protein